MENKRRLFALMMPPSLWLLIFFVAPLLIMVLYTFKESSFGDLFPLTLDNYQTFIQTPSFFRLLLNSAWLALLTVRDIILTFQWTFTPSFVMTGGDPYYATLFLPLLTYEEAFDRFRFGPGSALMLLMFGVTAALIVGLYLFFRARGYTGDT